MTELEEKFVKLDILEAMLDSDKIKGAKNQPSIEELEQMRNDLYLKQHSYKIYQQSDGKWCTNVKVPDTGKLKRLCRVDRKNLEKDIIKFYRSLEENPTINQLFVEWLDRKENYEKVAFATVTRYRNVYKRYFQTLKLKRIRSIKPIDIEDFVYRVIKEFELTRKEFNSIRTVLYGIFRLARRKELFHYDIQALIAEFQIPRRVFKQKVRVDEEEVFFPEDEQKLIEVLKRKDDLRNLGLRLLFKTGMRIGELSALKPEDINGHYIHICRTETKFYDDRGKIVHDVIDRPKTEAGVRDIVIKDDAVEIIHKIRMLNPFGTWLFEENGKRLNDNCFRQRLYRACDWAGIPRRSPHKIRKTYGTKLYDSDLPKSFICNQMGHTDISCLEKYYYFNMMDRDEKLEALNKVSSI